MSSFAAKSRVTQAREYLGNGRLDLVESTLAAAEKYLVGLPAEETAPITEEIAALRVELANQPSEAEQRQLTAARGKLRQARSQIAEKSMYGTPDTLAKAEEYLLAVREAHRGAVAAELAAVKAEYEAATAAERPAPAPVVPVAAPPPPAPPPASAPAPAPAAVAAPLPSEPESRQLSAARGKIRQARSQIADKSLYGTPDTIAKAEEHLMEVRAEHRGEVAAELAAVKAEYAAALEAERPPPKPVVPVTAAPVPAASSYAHAAPTAVAPPAPSEPETRYLSAARGKIRQARTQIADKVLYGTPDTIAKAEEHLMEVREEHRGAVADDLAAVKAEYQAALAEERAASMPPQQQQQQYAHPPQHGYPPPAYPPPHGYPPPPSTPPHPNAPPPPPYAQQQQYPTPYPPPPPPSSPYAQPYPPPPPPPYAQTPQYPPPAAPPYAQSPQQPAPPYAQPPQHPAPPPYAQSPQYPPPTTPYAQLPQHPAMPNPQSPHYPAPPYTPPSPASVPAASPPLAELSDADRSTVSRVRGFVNSARSHVESGRTELVEPNLAQARELLAQVPAHAAASWLAEIAEITELLREAIRAEASRRVTGELNRQLSKADSDIAMLRIEPVHEAIALVMRRLDEDDVRGSLSSDEIAAYRARAEKRLETLANALKADAIDRAQPLLGELEEQTASDPYVGLDSLQLRDKAQNFAILRARAMGALRHVPDTDPDIRVLVSRIIAVDHAIEAAAARWGKAALDEQVSNSWETVEQAIAGWQDESIDADDPSALHPPTLPLTRTAIQRTRILLEDSETQRIRAAHPGDATIQAPFQLAERVFAEASAKLASAFSRVLDVADGMETPLSQFLLRCPSQLAYGAEAVLAGSPHRDAIVARARAIDERWKVEVAAIMKARQDLYDKLAREAELHWPRLRETLDVVPFDRYVAPGMLVRLDRIYNRCGWDYGGREFDFAARVDGVVLAGTYAPHIRKALEYVWYELKLDVNDRIPWDLIAVIEGDGKIGVRTQVTLRDRSTGAKLGELEEWPLVDCVRIRIIGLHAGPLAVARADS